MGEVEYRVAWAKSYLKKAGYLTQSTRGVWALTSEGKSVDAVDVRAILTDVRKGYVTRRKEKEPPQTVLGDAVEGASAAIAEVEAELGWKQQVLDALLAMPPDAFERLSQRLLRECGFTQVEVTGRSGDGGIDGKGVLRLGGLINFQVVFQCKRYAGTVSSGAIRDFRGAMIGRADKGLIISTGTFSRDARAEAVRDGAPAIDLVVGRLHQHGSSLPTFCSPAYGGLAPDWDYTGKLNGPALPKSGFCQFFSAVLQAQRRPPLALCAVFVSVGRCPHVTAPNTY
jgi:restriction system protein